MRVAKWPFAGFQDNLRKAQALAVAQQFLNRFLDEGPEEFMLSSYAELTGTLKGVIGIDVFTELIQPIVSDIGKEITSKYEGRIRESVALANEETAKRAGEKLLKLVEPIVSVTTLRGQTLLEQAVVLGVSAYEAYVTNTVDAILRLNPKLLDRFTPELDEGLKWSRISRHGRDALEAARDHVLRKWRLLDLDQVNGLFGRLTDIENIIGDGETERGIRKFIEHRHLIVHRAGRVDRKFQETTGSRQARGTTVELTTTYIGEGLERLSGIVAGIQTRLERHATGKTETEPPE